MNTKVLNDNEFKRTFSEQSETQYSQPVAPHFASVFPFAHWTETAVYSGHASLAPDPEMMIHSFKRQVQKLWLV